MLAALIMPALVSGVALAAEKPMNVIFILADDLGYSDTTLYGTTDFYQTPHLERLAKRGMTFTRAYSNSPLCSPTRASILTGQTPARHGSTSPGHHLPTVRMKPVLNERAKPGSKALIVHSVTRLDTAYPSLVKLIRKVGYQTAHFGKWHLGPKPYSPLQHGFDVDIPHHPGPGPAGSYVAPWRFKNFKANHPGEHIEDRMAEEAVGWLRSLPAGKPFFMNYWQFSVHAPFDAKKELIEEYRKKIDPKNPQRSPTYAAMVHSLDDAVGSLLDVLDEKGVAEKTVIVFISDNGGNMYNRIEDDGNVTPTSNAPLRGGKATMYEGGIRVPCIVVWPGLTNPGSRSDEIIQASDFYPTLLNGLGIDLPGNHEVDGIDIRPALEGGKLDRKGIFTYFPHAPPVPDWLPPSMSVHSGDWKLIRIFHEGENGAHDYRLYNLAKDIGEKNNLAALHPEKVQMLDRMIENHIKDSKAVVPRPNPGFDPNQYHPEQIGVPAARHKPAAKPSAKPGRKPGGVVGGWIAGGTARLKGGKGTLFVESEGGDPYLTAQKKFHAAAGGPYRLHLRIKSTSSGRSEVKYWEKAGPRPVSIPFPLTHDGAWHEHEIDIPAKRLLTVRIDPSTSPGKMEIDWIRLKHSSGEIIQGWSFDR
jgi:arylsulfatase A-like enzyme